MKFQSHVPSWAFTDPAIPKGQFNTLADLLAHPWIKGWNEPEKKDFSYCWSKNEGKWSKALLMATWTEPSGKKTWWVLGYMSEIPEELPEWQAPKSERPK